MLVAIAAPWFSSKRVKDIRRAYFFKISWLLSVEASSTTMISLGGASCESTDSRAPSRYEAWLKLGITTEIGRLAPMRPNSSAILRNIRHFGARALLPINYLDFILSSRRASAHVSKFVGEFNPQEVLKSQPLSGPNVFVLACYITSEDDEASLKHLFAESMDKFDDIIIINTGGFHPKLESRVIYIERPNYGRDLYSYSLGIKIISHFNVEKILLVNDSVFWGPGAITAFWESAKIANFEVIGMTDSNQGPYHLQSFALCLNKLDNSTLSPFSEIAPCYFKRSLVEYGEKRLSQNWISNKVQLGAVWKIDELSATINSRRNAYGRDFLQLENLINSKVPLNPTIHFWPELYLKAGIVKKSLLFKNPARFVNPPKSLLEVQTILGELSGDNLKGD